MDGFKIWAVIFWKMWRMPWKSDYQRESQQKISGIPPNREQTEAPESVDDAKSAKKILWHEIGRMRPPLKGMENSATLKWWNWKNGSAAAIWNSSTYLCADSTFNSLFWFSTHGLLQQKKHMAFLTKIFQFDPFECHKVGRRVEWVITHQKGHPHSMCLLHQLFESNGWLKWNYSTGWVKTSKCYSNLLTTFGDSIRVHHKYNFHKGRVPVGAPSIALVTSSHRTWLVALMGQKKRTWHDSWLVVLPKNSGTLTKTNSLPPEKYGAWKLRRVFFCGVLARFPANGKLP